MVRGGKERGGGVGVGMGSGTVRSGVAVSVCEKSLSISDVRVGGRARGT